VFFSVKQAVRGEAPYIPFDSLFIATDIGRLIHPKVIIATWRWNSVFRNRTKENNANGRTSRESSENGS
jgi:hypothetical protein